MTEKGFVKAEPAGVWSYVKEAFLFRWNVLALAGGVVAALISPAPDVVLPLLCAGELAYLAGLTAIPRFRAAIDAKEHAKKTGPLVGAKTAPPKQSLTDMVSGLEEKALRRFSSLRNRCLSMQNIAHGVRGRTGKHGSGADDLRAPALDRLLWVFLRLLVSQQALARFLESTDEAGIKARLESLQAKETQARDKGDERILRSVTDAIATFQLRLDNYQKAQSNAEFVDVELDRIEGKIQALSETAVGHQDPDYISSQVDSVAESMSHTEEAIRELTHITGLTEEMEEPPPILQAEIER